MRALTPQARDPHRGRRPAACAPCELQRLGLSPGTCECWPSSAPPRRFRSGAGASAHIFENLQTAPKRRERLSLATPRAASTKQGHCVRASTGAIMGEGAPRLVARGPGQLNDLRLFRDGTSLALPRQCAPAAGGPDTSIVVCNFGTHSVRIGFAGDAVPFYDEPSVSVVPACCLRCRPQPACLLGWVALCLPTSFALTVPTVCTVSQTVWAAPEAPGGPAAGGSRKRPRPTTGRRIFFAAGAAPAGCEITSPVKAGLVSDWDAAWAHIERALSRADGEAAPPSAAAQAALAAPSSSLPSSSTSSSCPGGGSGGSLRRSALQGRRLLVVDNLLAPRAAREAWAEEALAWRGAAGISFIREPVAIW